MSIITTVCRALLVIVAVLALGAAASDQALAQSAYNPAFDHYSTGWPLEGSHRGVD